MEEIDDRSIISNGSGLERPFHSKAIDPSNGKWTPDHNQNFSDLEERGSQSGEKVSISSAVDLRERLQQSENEKIAVIMDHNNMIRKCNERIDTHLREIQILEEHNRGLQANISEMRDLCCYLDDERKKCRQVAKEWQRFGRYTVGVMRDEVISYSDKLKNLERKQTDLMKENGELRDLCVYLDQSRRNENGAEDGNLLNFVICRDCKKLRRENEDVGLNLDVQPACSDKTYSDDHTTKDDYVNKLEARIRQLEEEREFFITTFASKKSSDKKRVSFSVPEDDCDSSSLSEQDKAEYDYCIRPPPYRAESHQGILRNGFLSPPPRKDDLRHKRSMNDSTDKISQAMRVLEIQEKLDRGSTSSNGSEEPLTEPEVAILKQVCNAAWSKLGDEENRVPMPSALPDSPVENEANQ